MINNKAVKVISISLLILVTGCSEPSMFEKCMTKEKKDFQSLSDTQRIKMFKEFGGPYYSKEIVEAANELLAAFKLYQLNKFSQIKELAESNYQFLALSDKVAELRYKEPYHSYNKRRVQYNKSEISLEEFESKASCEEDDKCAAIEKEITNTVKQLNVFLEEIPFNEEIEVAYQSSFDKLEQLIEESLIQMTFEQWLEIPASLRYRASIENMTDNGERSLKYAADDVAMALSTSIFYKVSETQQDTLTDLQSRISYYSSDAPSKNLHSALSGFIQAPSIDEIATEICNRRGLYE